MKNKILKLFFSVIILQISNLLSISIVYNFRIAQITKQRIFENENRKKRHYTLLALLFDQYYKKRYDNIRQNYLGGLGSFIYNSKSYYVRADFAASHIYEKTFDSKFSDAQVDDILFSLGKNFNINKQSKLTLTGLFGVPTHKNFALQHPQFGYGQYGLGIQADGSYEFNNQNAFLYGVRYINFLPSDALDPNDNKYKFTIGNLADILVASKNNWRKHGFEVGYTARFDFGAKIYPNLDDIIEKTNYIRSNFYAVYKYRFVVNNVANRFLLNLSYSFDHVPKKFGNKYIIFVWAAWDFRF